MRQQKHAFGKKEYQMLCTDCWQLFWFKSWIFIVRFVDERVQFLAKWSLWWRYTKIKILLLVACSRGCYLVTSDIVKLKAFHGFVYRLRMPVRATSVQCTCLPFSRNWVFQILQVCLAWWATAAIRKALFHFR